MDILSVKLVHCFKAVEHVKLFHIIAASLPPAYVPQGSIPVFRLLSGPKMGHNANVT